MPNRPTSPITSADATEAGTRTLGPDRRSDERQHSEGEGRRHKLRLRELCDEVIASHRAARERDLFSDGDRAAARAMIGEVAAGK